jgi:hypothetical protein
MAKSIGWASKLAMDAALPFDTSSEAFEFVSESIQMQIEQIPSEGIRGTRSRRGERMQQGLKRIGGTISLNPSQAELDKLLPRILGADESTDVFAVADTLPQFYVMVDRKTKVFRYGPCRVGSANFSGSTGQKILLAMDIVAEGDEVITDAGTFPSISIDTENCIVFHQGVLTLRGTSTEMDQFGLRIDNVITPTFENSQTATDTATDTGASELCEPPRPAGMQQVDAFAAEPAGGSALRANDAVVIPAPPQQTPISPA